MTAGMKHSYSAMLNKLLKLKKDFCATGIKLEFETEYTSRKDIDFVKRLALDSNLDLAIKIGGCGSVRDIELAEKVAPQSLVAPMIESRYSLEKFYTTAKSLCRVEDVDLFFNLETIDGYNNLDKILSYEYINEFKGIVFGRSDFMSSLNKFESDVNSKLLLHYVNILTEKIENTNLELILGGCISGSSKEFLKNVEGNSFKKVETRKIIFDKEVLKKDFENALNLAFDFELTWLEAKEQKTIFDQNRLDEISKRFNKGVLIEC